MKLFVSTAKLSENGLDFIKKHEGCRLTAYKVPGANEKHFTIGYGHYSFTVKEGMKISQKLADHLLKEDLEYYVTGVNKYLKVVVNQNQFDALVSLAFNIGLSAFSKSTLIRKLNRKDYIGASEEFIKWNKASGKVLPGLTKRRQHETDLFRS